MRYKKVLPLLLAFIMMFSFALTACDDSGSGSQTTAPAVENDPAVEENPNDTPAEETNPAEEEDTASAPAPAPEAEADPPGDGFEFVVLRFNDRDFELPQLMQVEVGGDITLQRGTVENHCTAADAIHAAFQQPLRTDEANYAHRFTITQNPEFWSNISHIEASFYLVGVCDWAEPGEIGYIHSYTMFGRTTGWAEGGGWNFDGRNMLLQHEETGYGAMSSEYMFNVTWPINEYWLAVGNNDIPNYDAEEEADDDGGGGVLKFGLMIRNDGFDDITIGIRWADAAIYVFDMDKFNEYVDYITEITGVTMPADAKVFEVS